MDKFLMVVISVIFLTAIIGIACQTAYVYATSKILYATDGNGKKLQNNGITSSNSIAIRFSNSFPIVECKLDHQSLLKSCTSPTSLRDLGTGLHTFKVVDCFPDFKFNKNGSIVGKSIICSDPDIFSWTIVH